MHGAKGAYHGFVELAPDSYVAFVQMPENSKDIEYRGEPRERSGW